jgi:valyl-tRNA synthetase
MPFITEELWQRLPHQGVSISIQEFPKFDPRLIDEEAEARIRTLQDWIVKTRNFRSEMNVDPKKRIEELKISLAEDASNNWKAEVRAEVEIYLGRLVGAQQIKWSTESSEIVSSQTDQLVHRIPALEGELIPLGQLGDKSAEKTRLEKEISRIGREMAPIQQKLLNADFLAHAPEHVVKLNQTRLLEFQEKLSKLSENLKRL